MEALIGADPFAQIAALLVLAAAVGLIGLDAAPAADRLPSWWWGWWQGRAGLGLVQHGGYLELLAELGVALLLFLVGLKLDLGLVKSLGLVSLTTGLGQVAFTAGFGFLICLWLGMDAVTSLYVAVALTFSSTIIIVKLLSDKREIDSLHGRIAVGFLIVQDLVVVLAMVVLSALGVGARGGGLGDLLSVLGAGVGLLGLAALFIRYAATPLARRLARAPELLLAFAVAMAAAFAAIGEAAGFGKELGGLLAGVALASTPVRDLARLRLAPLRDFLLLFFFVVLGAGLELKALGEEAWPAIVLSLFVLIGNPLIVMVILALMGYRKRTGFLAGLTVAQISEFSLIFMAVGVSLGHVTESCPCPRHPRRARHHRRLHLHDHLVAPSLRVAGAVPRPLRTARPGARARGTRPARPRAGGDPVRPWPLRRRDCRTLAPPRVSVLGVDFNPEAVRAFKRAASRRSMAMPRIPNSLPICRWRACAGRSRPCRSAISA